MIFSIREFKSDDILMLFIRITFFSMYFPLLRKPVLFLFLITVLSVLSCRNGNPKIALPAEPDMRVAEQQVVIKRYEKALFALDPKHLRSGLKSIYPDYAFFMGKDWSDTMNILRIYNFLTDPNIKQLYDLTEKKYADVSSLEKGLGKAMNRFREAYPEKPFPTVYTYVSGLDADHSVYYFDTAMAVGLDLFLGNDVQAYVKAGLPKYKINRFSPEYILPQCMLAVSDHLIRTDQNNNTLLDEMVAAGKALYFLDVTLPDVEDKFKIGYTSEQLSWGETHAGDIWAFLIENQLLFSSDQKSITKLMTDAPFTAGFDSQSPGRLGVFLGWQIVRSYMKEASHVTLKQLMENTDSQQILKISKYKPAKA